MVIFHMLNYQRVLQFTQIDPLSSMVPEFFLVIFPLKKQAIDWSLTPAIGGRGDAEYKWAEVDGSVSWMLVKPRMKIATKRS